MVLQLEISDNYIHENSFSKEMWDLCGRTSIEFLQYIGGVRDCRRYHIGFNIKGISTLKTLTREKFITIFSAALASFLADPEGEEKDRGVYDSLISSLSSTRMMTSVTGFSKKS